MWESALSTGVKALGKRLGSKHIALEESGATLRQALKELSTEGRIRPTLSKCNYTRDRDLVRLKTYFSIIYFSMVFNELSLANVSNSSA